MTPSTNLPFNAPLLEPRRFKYLRLTGVRAGKNQGGSFIPLVFQPLEQETIVGFG